MKTTHGFLFSPAMFKLCEIANKNFYLKEKVTANSTFFDFSKPVTFLKKLNKSY